MIRDYEWTYAENMVPKGTYPDVKGRPKFDVLLTTFEVVMKDPRPIQKISWRIMIVDEAHRLKNTASATFKEIQAIQRDHCVLLTGTPLQNRTEELWAILHVADRIHFNDVNYFLERFGEMATNDQV